MYPVVFIDKKIWRDYIILHFFFRGYLIIMEYMWSCCVSSNDYRHFSPLFRVIDYCKRGVILLKVNQCEFFLVNCGKEFLPAYWLYFSRTHTHDWIIARVSFFFVDHTRFSRCKRRKVKLNEKVLCKEEKCTKHTFANHTYIDRFLPFRFFSGVVCFF